jgi:hypothetical protein
MTRLLPNHHYKVEGPHAMNRFCVILIYKINDLSESRHSNHMTIFPLQPWRRWSCDLYLRLFSHLSRISKNARSRMGPPNTNGGWLGTWVMTPFFVNSVFRARSFWWCTWRRVCPPQLSLSFSVFDDLLAIE